MQHELIYVTRSSMPSFEEYCEEIRGLWDSHILTNCGQKHIKLEEALQKYLGVEHMTLFVNGHSALECILETMELGHDGRDEVITTPFTFASTTHAIVRKGLKPVFCDVKPDDCTMDPEKIEPLISEKTCAILPVHVYGHICDVEAIDAIAKAHDLKVVYDAAHAFGVKVNGVGVGNFGDAAMFSFHATKVFNTIEGGAVAYSDGMLTERLAQWRNFGITSETTVEYVGGNSKMNEFAAAMGLCNLRHVDDDIASRKHIAERYWERLEKVPGIRFRRVPAGVQHNYAYMPVLVDPIEYGTTRDDIYNVLALKGVRARKYFYPLTSDYECYRKHFNSADTPVAKRAAECVLTLPIYPDLSLDQIDCICDIMIGVR